MNISPHLSWVGVVVVALTVSSCAAVADTPKQAKVRADFDACKAETGSSDASLTAVNPDGSFRWRYGSTGDQFAQEPRMKACMRSKGYRFYEGPTVQ